VSNALLLVVTDAIELIVGERRVRVTSPEKVYFPELGFTKVDVVRYFLSVGDGILAAVRDRPTMLERWPGGMAGEAIFQRRVARGVPDWVRAGPDGVYPTELAVVAWAASLGTLRFHPSPVRLEQRERPDELRIDLDPQPGTGFRDAVTVATELRGLLADAGLQGLPKTTGGRGLHVTVPIEPRWRFEEFAAAQSALARSLVRRMPRTATMERRKPDRGARVYVDHGQFLVAAAYSIRPVPRALVSAPVTWDELESAEPEDFDVTTMPGRFARLGDVRRASAGSIDALV
jgi:DNA ligase D-like protein (predicted polymerase)